MMQLQRRAKSRVLDRNPTIQLLPPAGCRQPEKRMTSKRFTQPVSIIVGLGFPREIETVSEAFQVLNEWNGARGPTHATSLNVCRAASAGDVDVEAARVAFEEFARSRSILALDALAMAAERVADEWLGA
jgi:hypothetical protein